MRLIFVLFERPATNAAGVAGNYDGLSAEEHTQCDEATYY